MLEKYPVLRAKNILLFTFCILLNLSETGHMTENKVIPEKQMQNLLICLCNKAVGIHAFYLCYFMWYVRSPHCSPAWTPSSRNLKPSNYQWKNFIKHSEFDLSAILFKQDLNTLKNQGYQVKLINCYKVKLINVLHTKNRGLVYAILWLTVFLILHF